MRTQQTHSQTCHQYTVEPGIQHPTIRAESEQKRQQQHLVMFNPVNLSCAECVFDIFLLIHTHRYIYLEAYSIELNTFCDIICHMHTRRCEYFVIVVDFFCGCLRLIWSTACKHWTFEICTTFANVPNCARVQCSRP